MSAPNAPGLVSPISSVAVDCTIVQRFQWIFSDPDVGDSQSAFDLQYRVVGAGSWTGVSGTTANNFYDLAASTLAANNYEWQVRTYDSIGTVGPWSASGFFSAATPTAGLSITSPTSGATVPQATTFTWSDSAQTSYQFRRARDLAGAVDTSTIYFDTGEVVSVPARSIVLNLETNNRYEWLQIRIKNSGIWSAWVGIRVLVSYTQPSPGTISVVNEDSTGSLLITVAPAVVGSGEPTPISVDIYVREISVVGFGDRILAGQYPSGTYRWHLPISGLGYEVRSLTTADNGTQRWSSAVYVHFIDGGSPVAPAWTLFIDGGTPTTVFTNAIDGGIP